MGRDKADLLEASSESGGFRALSATARPAPFDRSPQDPAGTAFRPLSWTDGRQSRTEPSSNSQNLAARFEEVQQLAYRKGMESGREEAVRLAQASLIPHLKSMLRELHALIDQAGLAEQQTGANGVSLAMTIVEKVIGAAAGRDDFNALQAEIGRAVAEANRLEIGLHQEDLNFLRELSENSGLAWPESDWLAFQTGPATSPGQVHISDPKDRREKFFQHVTEQISKSFA